MKYIQYIFTFFSFILSSGFNVVSEILLTSLQKTDKKLKYYDYSQRINNQFSQYLKSVLEISLIYIVPYSIWIYID